MKNPRTLAVTIPMIVATLLLSSAAIAQDSNAEDTVVPVGTETRGWLEMQAGNASASAVERPMPGDIAAKTYQRYSDSFARPIPDQLGRQAFVSDGED